MMNKPDDNVAKAGNLILQTLQRIVEVRLLVVLYIHSRTAPLHTPARVTTKAQNLFVRSGACDTHTNARARTVNEVMI